MSDHEGGGLEKREFALGKLHFSMELILDYSVLLSGL